MNEGWPTHQLTEVNEPWSKTYRQDELNSPILHPWFRGDRLKVKSVFRNWRTQRNRSKYTTN